MEDGHENRMMDALSSLGAPCAAQRRRSGAVNSVRSCEAGAAEELQPLEGSMSILGNSHTSPTSTPNSYYYSIPNLPTLSE